MKKKLLESVVQCYLCGQPAQGIDFLPDCLRMELRKEGAKMGTKDIVELVG